MLGEMLKKCRRLVQEERAQLDLLRELEEGLDGVGAMALTGMPGSREYTSQTERRLERIEEMRRKVDAKRAEVATAQEVAISALRTESELTARFAAFYFVEALTFEQSCALIERGERQCRRIRQYLEQQ